MASWTPYNPGNGGGGTGGNLPPPLSQLQINALVQSALQPNGKPVSSTNPLITSDANGAAFQGVILVTPGTAVVPGRSIGYVCTAAGNVTMTLADDSVIVIAITPSASFQTLPFAVTNVALDSTANGTFWNLK